MAESLMGNQGELGPEDKIDLMNHNLINLLESGQGQKRKLVKFLKSEQPARAT
jgi:hypothetical protein